MSDPHFWHATGEDAGAGGETVVCWKGEGCVSTGGTKAHVGSGVMCVWFVGGRVRFEEAGLRKEKVCRVAA